MHLHLHGVEDLWGGMASCHFHTFLCNMGSFCVSITWGLACTLRRPVLFDRSFSLYLHTPRGSRHRRDSHCFLSSKYPPIDCTNISLRERRARLLHSEISFVIFRGWLGYRTGGKHIWSQHISFLGSHLFICTLQECPGEAGSMEGRGFFYGCPDEAGSMGGKGVVLYGCCA